MGAQEVATYVDHDLSEDDTYDSVYGGDLSENRLEPVLPNIVSDHENSRNHHINFNWHSQSVMKESIPLLVEYEHI